MYRDYPVSEFSPENIRIYAKQSRMLFAVIIDARVDLATTLRKSRILTIFGEKALEFKISTDLEHYGVQFSGMTTFSAGKVMIILSKSTNEALGFGEVQARNVAAHELAHAVLHEGPPMHWEPDTSNYYKWIPAFRSAENQAEIFAPAFLIDDVLALKLSNSEEIALRFGVDIESADAYLQYLRRREEKQKFAIGFRQLRRGLQSHCDPKQPSLKFLRDPCTNCGRSNVFPVGQKFMCQFCNRVYDRFQDGD